MYVWPATENDEAVKKMKERVFTDKYLLEIFFITSFANVITLDFKK
jgi:hypothetical protein